MFLIGESAEFCIKKSVQSGEDFPNQPFVLDWIGLFLINRILIVKSIMKKMINFVLL